MYVGILDVIFAWSIRQPIFDLKSLIVSDLFGSVRILSYTDMGTLLWNLFLWDFPH